MHLAQLHVHVWCPVLLHIYNCLMCLVFHLDSQVLLCDFHREKAWIEWIRKQSNGVSHVQDTLLTLLRDVASAATTEEYEEAVSRLHKSQVWEENERLRSWLSNKWLKDTCTRVCITISKMNICNVMYTQPP